LTPKQGGVGAVRCADAIAIERIPGGDGSTQAGAGVVPHLKALFRSVQQLLDKRPFLKLQ
jgi:hypothetical protein